MVSPQSDPSNADATLLHVTVDVEHRNLTPAGDIDLGTAAVLLDGVDQLAPIEGDITVDLAGVTFMDSIALGTLVQIATRQKAHGYQLIIANPSARQRRLFLIGGLAQMLRNESSPRHTR